MPNYKVHVELNNHEQIHAIEIYLQAESILIAGNKAVEILNDGVTVEDANVNRIYEIEPRKIATVAEEDHVHSCGYYMSVVPPLRYSCAKSHKEFRRTHSATFKN